MTEIRFYHLTSGTLEHTLPIMLDRAVGRDGRRAVVMANSPDRVEALNAHLWTFDDRSFLAHGSAKDGFAPDQPVWLTDRDENLNGASVCFLTEGAAIGDPSGFELVCELFDGNDEAAVAEARTRWRHYREDGHQITYFQQDEGGRWQKKTRD